MSKSIVHKIEEGQVAIKHGDYQRIADVTKKPDGTPYTADYVRKVLLGRRDNLRILKVATHYFKRLEKLEKELTELAAA